MKTRKVYEHDDPRRWAKIGELRRMGVDWARHALRCSTQPCGVGNIEHDNACAEEFLRLTGKPPHHPTLLMGTAWKNHHPIVVLWLNKLDSLCTSDCGDTDAFFKAYELCQKIVQAYDLAQLEEARKVRKEVAA